MTRIEEMKREIAKIHRKGFEGMAHILKLYSTITEAIQESYDHYVELCTAKEINPLEVLKETFGGYKEACESAFREMEAAIAAIEKEEAGKNDNKQ